MKQATFYFIMLIAGAAWLCFPNKEIDTDKCLNSFANPRKDYKILSRGYFSIDGDTVFFKIVPSEQENILNSKDEVIIKKASGENFRLTRGYEDGKAIKYWDIDKTYIDYNFVKKCGFLNETDYAKLQNFMKIFEYVVDCGDEYGCFSYNGLNSTDKLQKFFVNEGYSIKKSARLAKKATRLNFSVL